MNRRALHVICGASVLFAALALAHIILHFFGATGPHMSPGMWLSFATAAAADIFAFVGGYLLLMSGQVKP